MNHARRRWFERHDLQALAAILILGALLRASLFVGFRELMPVDLTEFTELDNHTWHEFGARIASGDLLYRNAFIPMHMWARAMAPAEQWIEWYGGPSAYYQAPLYGYLVGAVYAVSGADPDHVRLLQLFLGLIRIVLIYAIARRLLHGWAPLVAALLAAIDAPAMFFELTLLRVTVLTVLHLSVLLLLLRAWRDGRALRWAALGCVAGLEFLAKPSPYPVAGLVLLAVWGMAGASRAGPAAAGSPLPERRTPPARARLGLAALYLAAFAAPLALLAARNAAVGQPLLQLSTRGPITFIAGNAPDGIVDGKSGFYVPPSAGEIVRATDHRMVATVATVLRRHRSPWSYLRLLARKARAFWRDYETPNNVDFYTFSNVLSTLRLPFSTYTFICPLGILGVIVTRRRWRTLLPVYGLAVLVFLFTIAFLVMSRMRLIFILYLTLFAAPALVWLAAAVLERRWRRLGFAVAVLLAVLIATARPQGWTPSMMESKLVFDDLRDFQKLQEQMAPDPERALTFGEARDILYAIRQAYAAGRYEECLYPLQSVLQSYPDLVFTRYVLARCCFELYLDDGTRRDYLERARQELDGVLAREPGAPYVRGLIQGMRQVEAGGADAGDGAAAAGAAARGASTAAAAGSTAAARLVRDVPGDWNPAAGACQRLVYGEDRSTWVEGGEPDDAWITVRLRIDAPIDLEVGTVSRGGFVPITVAGETEASIGFPPAVLVTWCLREPAGGRLITAADDAEMLIDAARRVDPARSVEPRLETAYFARALLLFDVDRDGLPDAVLEVEADGANGFIGEACREQ